MDVAGGVSSGFKRRKLASESTRGSYVVENEDLDEDQFDEEEEGEGFGAFASTQGFSQTRGGFYRANREPGSSFGTRSGSFGGFRGGGTFTRGGSFSGTGGSSQRTESFEPEKRLYQSSNFFFKKRMVDVTVLQSNFGSRQGVNSRYIHTYFSIHPSFIEDWISLSRRYRNFRATFCQFLFVPSGNFRGGGGGVIHVVPDHQNYMVSGYTQNESLAEIRREMENSKYYRSFPANTQFVVNTKLSFLSPIYISREGDKTTVINSPVYKVFLPLPHGEVVQYSGIRVLWDIPESSPNLRIGVKANIFLTFKDPIE